MQQLPHADCGMCTCSSAAVRSQLNKKEYAKYHLFIISVIEADA